MNFNDAFLRSNEANFKRIIQKKERENDGNLRK